MGPERSETDALEIFAIAKTRRADRERSDRYVLSAIPIEKGSFRGVFLLSRWGGGESAYFTIPVRSLFTACTYSAGFGSCVPSASTA